MPYKHLIGNIISQSGGTVAQEIQYHSSGASQTGFGRSGSVDWDTGSIKTADFTAANGEGYFCNTTSSASNNEHCHHAGSAGNIVSVQDYKAQPHSNKITINRNSSKINGGARFCSFKYRQAG